jgi:hypothetical protein
MSWLIDDIDLSNYAYNISNRAAGWRTPGKRGDNLIIPGRHGAQWLPNKPFEQGSVSLNMWAVGANEDGTLPLSGDRRQQCRANLDKLTALFGQTSKLLSVVQISSNTFGVQNMITDPAFEDPAIASAWSTYQNYINNPAMRLEGAAGQFINLAPNPNAETSIGFANTDENVFKDPWHKFYRNSGSASLVDSNYINGGSSFELWANDEAPDGWSAGSNIEVVVKANTANDQTDNPRGGTKVLRIFALAGISSGAVVATRNPVYYPPNSPVRFRFRMRRAQNTTDIRSIRLRVQACNSSDTVITSSPYKSFTIPTTSSTWNDFTMDASEVGFEINGTTTTQYRLEWTTGQAWDSGDGVILDMMYMGPADRGFPAGNVFYDTPGPFWDAYDVWRTEWNSTVGSSISRWSANVDDRWVPDLPTNTNSAFHAFATVPYDTEPTGTAINFVAMGFHWTSGGTQAFLAQCDTPTVGMPYRLLVAARALSGKNCTIQLYKKGSGDANPVAAGPSISFTGSGSAVSTGMRISGSSTDYESATTYTPVSGDVLYVRVVVPVLTTGNPVMAIGSLSVTNSRERIEATEVDDSNQVLSWSGTAFNSKTVRTYRKAKRFSPTRHKLLSGIRSGSETTSFSNVVFNEARTDSEATELLLEDVILPSTRDGLYFSADVLGDSGFDEDIVDVPGVPSARAVLYALDSSNNIVSTHMGSTVALNNVSSRVLSGPSGVFKSVSVSVPETSLTAAVSRVRCKIEIISPERSQAIMGRNFVISPSSLAPSTFLPSATFYNPRNGTMVWSGTPEDSTSSLGSIFADSWSTSGSPIASLIGGDEATARGAGGSLSFSTNVGSTLPVADYQFGVQLQAETRTSSDTNAGGAVDVYFEFRNGSTRVGSQVYLGTLSGKAATVHTPFQVYATPSGSFNTVAVVLAGQGSPNSTVGSVRRAYLYPASSSFNNPIPRIDINRVNNPFFTSGYDLWTAAGGTPSTSSSSTGRDVLLGNGVSIQSQEKSIRSGSTTAMLVSRVRNGSSGGVISASVIWKKGDNTTQTVSLGAISNSTSFGLIYNTLTVPANTVSASVKYTGTVGSGTNPAVSFSWLGFNWSGSTMSTDIDPSNFFYGDGTVGDFYGTSGAWNGTPDASVSRFQPSISSSWVNNPTTNGNNVHLISSPVVRPPNSFGGKVGALLRLAKNASATYRTVGVPVGSNTYVSGQLNVATLVGASVRLRLYGASSSTASGTLLWTSSNVGSASSATLTFNDIAIPQAYAYLEVTYTESSDVAGYRVFLDNAMILPSDEPLGADYPGYFDGNVGGGGWTGNANQSTSEYYGGGRRAYCEVVDAIDMTSMAGGTRAEFNVDMIIPGAFWEDLVVSNMVFTLPSVVNYEQTLAPLQSGTAPVDDALITLNVTGTLSNLTLTDMASGAEFLLSGTLPGTIEIDNKNFTVKNGATSLIANVTRKNSNQLLPLTPMSSTEAPRLKVNASGAGSITMTIVARRRYLIA